MRFVTRCPACRALFEVRDEQLQACQGWLRCGQCFKAYDSTGLVLPWSTVMASEAAQRVDIRTLLNQPDVFASGGAVTDAQALGGGDSHEPEAQGVIRAESGGIVSFAAIPPSAQRSFPELSNVLRNGQISDQGATDDGPVPIHQPKKVHRNWPWALACVLAALLLIPQAMQAPMNSLQLTVPAVQRWGQMSCTKLGCAWPGIRDADAVHLDSARLIREEGRLILHVRLRNAAPVDVLAGAIELSLLEDDSRILARRVLGPDALGVPPVLPAGAAWEGRVLLMLDEPSLVQGYRALWILP